MTDARVDDVLLDALGALARWLREADVPYALIGGIAVGLQAVPRFTQDIDAVVWTADDRWAELVALGERFAIRPRIGDVLGFARRSRVLLLAHESGVPIDVSCGALPFEQDLVERAELFDVGPFSVRVASAEHLIVTKAIANRPRDRVDIENLLRVFPDLDTTRARQVVAEFSDALELPDLLEEFDRAVRRSR